MASTWPLLDVYHVSTQEELVAKCLGTLRGLRLIEQFNARNVTTLQMMPLPFPGRLALTSEMNGGFVIHLNAEIKEDTILCRTVAQELGRTFEYDPRTRRRFTDASLRWLPASENFAKAFGREWLSNIEQSASLAMIVRSSFPQRLRSGNGTPPVLLWA